MVPTNTMKKQDPKVNIVDLQADVLKLLDAGVSLLQRAGKPLGREDHYKGLASQLKEARGSVAALELRMAIVAPMKAGKSTIVNAAVGRDVLPARNSAMTSLPTEVVHEEGLDEPEMWLSSSALRIFRASWSTLRETIANEGLESVANELGRFPETAPLIERIRTESAPRLAESIHGEAAVRDALLELNDICRVASIIDSDASPLARLGYRDIPRVRLGFRRPTSGALQPVGRLVIIDTPGPNEARMHAQLTTVVQAQLKFASVVMLVLDYTQMSGQAADEMSKEVQKVVDMYGEENLFVIVNKVDQRVPGRGQTKEQVLEFIGNTLGLKKVAQGKRVFELTAIHAFLANEFLQAPLKEDSQARSHVFEKGLLPLLLGSVATEKRLNKETLETLRGGALDLWENSGFDAFIDDAICTLMKEAAPRAIRDALIKALVHLKLAQNDLRIQHKASETDQEQLLQELNSFRIELQEIEKSRVALHALINEIEADLRRRLQNLIAEFAREAERDINDYFKKDMSGLARLGAEMREVFLSKSASKRFDKEADAESFAREAMESVALQREGFVKARLIDMEHNCNLARDRMSTAIKTSTGPLVARAAARLRKSFSVELEIPEPNLSEPKLELVGDTQLVRQIDEGYRTVIYYDDSVWYSKLTFGLVKKKLKKRIKIDDTYEVSLKHLVEELNKTFKNSLVNLQADFDDYLRDDFRRRVTTYYEKLRKYLAFYQESIEKAHAAQSRSLDERKAARETLAQMLGEMTRLHDETEKYAEWAGQVVRVNS